MAMDSLTKQACCICGDNEEDEDPVGSSVMCVCNACAEKLPVELATKRALQIIEHMASRQVGGREAYWLRESMQSDPRPEVRQAACNMYRQIFLKYKRGKIDLELTVHSLELYLHCEVWHEGGDVPVHARILADQSGMFCFTDYIQESVMQTTIDEYIARKFLKSLIHEWDILFWNQELNDCRPCEYPYTNTLIEFFFGLACEKGEELYDGSIREPLWSLKLKLSNGDSEEIVFYHQLHSETHELYWALTNFFEPESANETVRTSHAKA